MNLWAQFFASVVRYAAGVIFGALVVRGIISPELMAKLQPYLNQYSTQVAMIAVTFVVPLVWSYASKTRIGQVIAVALHLPARSTPEDLKAAIKAREI